MSKHDIYRKKAEEALKKVPHFIQGTLDQEDYLHVVSIGASVMMARDGNHSGGSFVQSIVENNLYEAFNRADSVCERSIKFFAYVNKHIYLD